MGSITRRVGAHGARGVVVIAAAVATIVLASESVLATLGDNSIVSPDPTGETGQWSDLALDSVGNAVIAYHDGGTNDDLKLMPTMDLDSHVTPTMQREATLAMEAILRP